MPSALPSSAAAPAAQEQLKIVIVGHVDHGKSTFVGRLFHDTGSLPEGKYEQLVEVARRRGVPFEFANLMDGLQAERDQNITIDTAQIWFRTSRRQYVIIDAPGHKEFLKNMITGAASASAALLLIDAGEGVQEQSRRHGFLLSLMGVRQIVVLVNKMDLCGFDERVFRRIESEYTAFLGRFGLKPSGFLPICARDGDGLIARSPRMPWHAGRTVVEALDAFEAPPRPVHQSLRFSVQDVYRFDHRRILAGRVESGALRVGDRLVFWPSGKSSVVNTIERWSAPSALSASAGESVGVTLTEQIFVERGQVATHEADAPAVARDFSTKIFWMGRQPLPVGHRVKLKLATQEVEAEIHSIERVIDASTLDEIPGAAKEIRRNDVAEVVIRARQTVALDPHSAIAETGRFVLVDRREVSGGGIVVAAIRAGDADAGPKSANLTWARGEVLASERALRNGHQGAVVWLTGLSGSGKSTLAAILERELFNRGIQAYRLDGDNLRYGLSADLGFSPEDRSENIRRAAEAGRLLADAGLVAISSLISPDRADRARVREIMKEGQVRFFEVYVCCPLEVCESRDPKKLYARARAGEIREFTGISAPYEAPEHPEITVRTDQQTPEESAASILDYLIQTGRLASVSYDI
ncbi:MAG: adenylyl-sulfate kinase [Verrucomicrobiae bacterium]|nr:adenylyl-sulfate kinase [Verrucomicrobiae bacterium]